MLCCAVQLLINHISSYFCVLPYFSRKRQESLGFLISSQSVSRRSLSVFSFFPPYCLGRWADKSAEASVGSAGGVNDTIPDTKEHCYSTGTCVCALPEPNRRAIEDCTEIIAVCACWHLPIQPEDASHAAPTLLLLLRPSTAHQCGCSYQER